MLAEALTALAAAGGTAVVQAAGTDAWAGFRAQVAKWFGRGDAQRERAALERLDQAAAALAAAGPGEVALARAVQAGSWQTRFETVLEGLNGAGQEQEQKQAAAELSDLLASIRGGWAAAIGPDAVAVAGDADIDIRGKRVAQEAGRDAKFAERDIIEITNNNNFAGTAGAQALGDTPPAVDASGINRSVTLEPGRLPPSDPTKRPDLPTRPGVPRPQQTSKPPRRES